MLIAALTSCPPPQMHIYKVCNTGHEGLSLSLYVPPSLSLPLPLTFILPLSVFSSSNLILQVNGDFNDGECSRGQVQSSRIYQTCADAACVCVWHYMYPPHAFTVTQEICKHVIFKLHNSLQFGIIRKKSFWAKRQIHRAQS